MGSEWCDCPLLYALTAIQLVSNDDEESNAGAESVDSDGYFT